MKKKIALIVPSLRGGGAERVMLNLATHLNKKLFIIREIKFWIVKILM